MNITNTDFVITDIVFAIHVDENHAKQVHNDRKYHGFAINIGEAEKTYEFDDGKTLVLGQNEIIFLPKSSSYKVHSKVYGNCYAINFEILDDKKFEPFIFKPKNFLGFLRRFEKTCVLWKNKGVPYRMECRALLYEILILMQKEGAADYVAASTSSIIHPAIEYIHKNYTNQSLSVVTLADACGISVDYFRKIFKRCYKTSPIKYVNELKLRYAKALLMSGDLPISKVAELSGFGDSAYFCREFKKSVGVSPSEYTY